MLIFYDLIKDSAPGRSKPASATMPGLHTRPSAAAHADKKVFTDNELTDIFEIDFAEIFGSPDVGLGNSNYRGINLPSKNNSRTGTGGEEKE